MAGIYTLLCLAITTIAFNNVIAVDYCNLGSCTQKGSHTMCRYPSTSPSKTCVQYKHNGLTDAEKKTIVDKHNQLRRKVASGQETRGNPGPQPPAVNMPDLIWDDELATIAQRWANQCNFNHDTCRNVDRFAVGQNIAITYNSAENNSPVESFVQMWYDEVDKFNGNGIDKYVFDPNTGHYTQIVWADTKTIGCGRIKYKESSGWNANYLVCNYGPSGNYIGQKIYQRK